MKQSCRVLTLNCIGGDLKTDPAIFKDVHLLWRNGDRVNCLVQF